MVNFVIHTFFTYKQVSALKPKHLSISICKKYQVYNYLSSMLHTKVSPKHVYSGVTPLKMFSLPNFSNYFHQQSLTYLSFLPLFFLINKFTI